MHFCAKAQLCTRDPADASIHQAFMEEDGEALLTCAT
jgi:hypothetical protein